MSDRRIVYKTRATKVEPIEEGWFLIEGGAEHRANVSVRILADGPELGTILRIKTAHTYEDIRITPGGRKIVAGRVAGPDNEEATP